MPTTGSRDDGWLETPRGRLFLRQWAPAHDLVDRGASILLFHDSLGCVDLWRDFPQQLASATGLRVVAYDRLGFGGSDPHPGPLPITFIPDEAVQVVPRLREKLGCDRMILFGHSVGGAMAIATAAHLAESCIGVVTESAQSFVEDQTRSGIRTAQADFEQPARLRASRDTTVRRLDGYWIRGLKRGSHQRSRTGLSMSICETSVVRFWPSTVIAMSLDRGGTRNESPGSLREPRGR